MRKNLIYHDTLSTKSDLQNNPKICATICATSLTAYWWVPDMFFGDKRVIGLQKSNKRALVDTATNRGASLTGLGFQKSNKRVPVKGLRREQWMSRKYSIC